MGVFESDTNILFIANNFLKPTKMANEEQLLPDKRPDEGVNSELIERFVAVQEKQLSLSLQEQEAGHRYAMASLEYDSRDRSEQRKFLLKLVAGQRILLGAIVGSLLVFTGIVLAMGKDAIAVEILKALAFFLAGGSVGWGLRRKGDDDRGPKV